jgi:hypothetical protein
MHTHPDCICTTDHMAIYIDNSDKLALTFAAEGSQEAMRQQGLSVAAAVPEEEFNLKATSSFLFIAR